MFGFGQIWMKPELEGKKLEHAIEKVKKIKDDRLLTNIAKKAPNLSVRLAAISVLTDSY